MLYVIGSLLTLIAGIMSIVVLVAAFKKSVGQGLLSLFVPLYILYFAFTQYASPKKKLILGTWIGGAVVGGALLVTAIQQSATALQSALTEAVKEASKSAPAEGVPAAAAAPAAGPATWVKLEKMGLKVEMPAGSKAEAMGSDSPSYMVNPEDYSYTVMVATVTEAHASTYDAAVKEVQSMNPGFKSFTKKSKTADGWVLEFESASAMDNSPLYGVVVRKTIGGKGYECTRNENAKALRDAVSKACATLAKM